MTTKEAAEKLGVTRRMVQWLIKHKKLVATKPGGRDYSITEDDLNAYVAKETVENQWKPTERQGE